MRRDPAGVLPSWQSGSLPVWPSGRLPIWPSGNLAVWRSDSLPARVGGPFDFFVDLFVTPYRDAPPSPPIEQGPLGDPLPPPPSPEEIARERLQRALQRVSRAPLGRGLFTEITPPAALVPAPDLPLPDAPPPIAAPGAPQTAAEAKSILETVGELVILSSPAWGAFLFTRYAR